MTACCPAWLAPLLLAAGLPAAAQSRVLPVENVRVGYAQVLHVEPVYQTLRATTIEQQCPQAGALTRMARAVKDAISREDHDTAGNASECRDVAVQRTYRRPIAYDVDYIYKGMKYRSRLASDPGNLLRVRVSVTPFVAGEAGD